mmetsp:Transcript_6963/g.13421  ORF Transcript_6963/g.13421 Transcript_6963/m.13421 type:complete len:215 (+) Transcript_6963:88-732(+)
MALMRTRRQGGRTRRLALSTNFRRDRSSQDAIRRGCRPRAPPARTAATEYSPPRQAGGGGGGGGVGVGSLLLRRSSSEKSVDSLEILVTPTYSSSGSSSTHSLELSRAPSWANLSFSCPLHDWSSLVIEDKPQEHADAAASPLHGHPGDAITSQPAAWGKRLEDIAVVQEAAKKTARELSDAKQLAKERETRASARGAGARSARMPLQHHDEVS